jgi:hypothetical protein
MCGVRFPPRFDPKPEHGVNCLAFHDHRNLRAVVGHALRIKPAKLANLTQIATHRFF